MCSHQFQNKLKEIRDYRNKNRKIPIIGLTGGEPFFYKHKQQGITYNIYDLINAIHNIISTSQIIIKTSGWESAHI